MKKVIILLGIFILVSNIVFAGNIAVKPFEYVCDLVTVKFQSLTSKIQTTTVTTIDGTYRIFTISNCEGVGITAVKIK